MLIDRQRVLSLDDIMDHGARPTRVGELFVLQFSHLEQTDDLSKGPWRKVHKGRKPTKRYVTAAYVKIAIPCA